jgi:hypothetical protein
MAKVPRKEVPVAEQILIRCHPALRAMVLRDADAESPRLTLSQVIVRILAKHYDDPQLAVIPKKPMGRPPKEKVA